MMNWHIVTSTMYKAGQKVAGDMYFLSDTREIYRGESLFTEAVTLCTEFPSGSIAVNRLYINSTTLEGKVHNGENWVTVINPVTVDATVTEESDNAVSSKAVVAYVAEQLKALGNISTPSEVVKELSWDNEEHVLTVTKGDNKSQTIVLNGLGVELEYESETGELKLIDANGEQIGESVNLDLERFVQSASYDPDTHQIKLVFNDDQEPVSIDVSALVDTYTAEGDSKALTLTVEGNVVKGSIKIASTEGNAITADENGLYVEKVDISGKLDKVEDATEGNLVVFGEDGTIVDSETTLDDAVNQALEDSEVIVHTSDIATSESLASSSDSASDEKVVSEKALIDALTWKETM